VFAAEGRGGEDRRDLYFHRWASDPDARMGPGYHVPEHARRFSLQELGLSAALLNCLESEGITTAADLCVRTAEELLEIRNLGVNRLQQVRDRLAAARLCLAGEQLSEDEAKRCTRRPT
jgi:DNA-directed RNA polymerase alpha subunit